jgi:molybdopterin-guanine dinucleotide biosynthesis adapter protein
MSNAPASAPIIGIAGWKKSGKTTLAVRLIEEFTRRGLRVASLKHAHHDLRIDDEETDSARHRRAGAQQVFVVSRERWALISELRGAPEPDFAEVVARLAPCDLIIVEGYKSQPIPKIEARRRAQPKDEPLAHTDPFIIAIAADHPVDGGGLPTFSLDDVAAIARFITVSLGLARPAAPGQERG